MQEEKEKSPKGGKNKGGGGGGAVNEELQTELDDVKKDNVRLEKKVERLTRELKELKESGSNNSSSTLDEEKKKWEKVCRYRYI